MRGYSCTNASFITICRLLSPEALSTLASASIRFHYIQNHPIHSLGLVAILFLIWLNWGTLFLVVVPLAFTNFLEILFVIWIVSLQIMYRHNSNIINNCLYWKCTHWRSNGNRFHLKKFSESKLSFIIYSAEWGMNVTVSAFSRTPIAQHCLYPWAHNVQKLIESCKKIHLFCQLWVFL